MTSKPLKRKSPWVSDYSSSESEEEKDTTPIPPKKKRKLNQNTKTPKSPKKDTKKPAFTKKLIGYIKISFFRTHKFRCENRCQIFKYYIHRDSTLKLWSDMSWGVQNDKTKEVHCCCDKFWINKYNYEVKRDKDNKFDSKAIGVYGSLDNTLLGYVPKITATPLCQLLEENNNLIEFKQLRNDTTKNRQIIKDGELILEIMQIKEGNVKINNQIKDLLKHTVSECLD